MKVLVTGGAGFVGSHLAEELAKKNDVVVFDNFSSGRKEFLERANAKVVLGDITDLQAIKDACNEVDSVYHFAADPDVRRSARELLENFRIDVLGTLNTLEGCRHPKTSCYTLHFATISFFRVFLKNAATTYVLSVSSFLVIGFFSDLLLIM